MRPPSLNPLFAALSALPGIGPKLEKVFARLLGRGDGEPPRVIDLLFHLPSGFVDRRHQPKLSEVTPDTVVSLTSGQKFMVLESADEPHAVLLDKIVAALASHGICESP